MADRDIIFKIGVVDHEQTGPRLKALADSVRGTMSDIEKSIASVGRAASTETARIGRSTSSVRDVVGATTASASSSRVNVGPTSAIPDYTRQTDGVRRFATETVKAREESAKLTASVKSVADLTFDKSLASMQTMVGELERIDAQSAKTKQSLQTVSKGYLDAVNSTAEGIGRLASGLTFLTVGNENAKQLVDTLLTAKGAIDVGLGVVKTFTSVASVLSLSKQKQELLNEQTRLGAERTRVATSLRDEYTRSLNREAVAIDRVVTSTRQLDRAQDALRANPGSVVGPRGSGRASVASTAAVEGISGGNVGQAVGTAALVVAIEKAFSSSAARQATAAVTRTGAGLAGAAIGGTAAFLGPVASAAAAFAAIVATGKGVVEAFDGTAGAANSATSTLKYLGETILGIPYDSIGELLARLGNSAGKFTGLSDLVGDNATSRLDARTSSAIAARLQREERARLFGQIGFDGRQQIRSNQAILDDLRVQIAPPNQRNGLQFQLLGQQQVRTAKELASAVGTIRSAAAGAAVSSEDLGIAYDRAKTIGKQLNDIQTQQYGLVRQEADIRRQSAVEAQKAAQERLRTEQESIKTAQEGLLTAKERFAQLSAEDQLRAKQAARQARIDPTSLTDAQRSLLRRVGDQSSINAARRADVAEANRAGFDQIFGTTERGQIAAAQVRAQQAQVQIQDQTRIQIDITRREKTLVDSLARQTMAAIHESNRRIQAQVKAQIDAAIEAQNRSEIQRNQANRAR